MKMFDIRYLISDLKTSTVTNLYSLQVFHIGCPVIDIKIQLTITYLIIDVVICFASDVENICMYIHRKSF